MKAAAEPDPDHLVMRARGCPRYRGCGSGTRGVLPSHGDGPWVPSTEALPICTWRLRASQPTSRRPRLREGGEQGRPRGWLQTAQAVGEARGRERGGSVSKLHGRGGNVNGGLFGGGGAGGRIWYQLELPKINKVLHSVKWLRGDSICRFNHVGTSGQQGPECGWWELGPDRAVTVGTESTQHQAGTGG